jgi:DNA-binding MarR family transcriptional regulator
MGKAELAQSIGRIVMRWQDATQAYDEAVGEIAGLNNAERRCLSFLYQGPRTAGAIAEATGLTPAAITALVDRLEARGYLRRTRSEEDRRKVLVELGPAAVELTARYYEPLGREGETTLMRFTEKELDVLLRCLADVVELQERYLTRLQDSEARQPG